MVELKGLANSLSYIYLLDSLAMTKNNEFNCSMNSSSATIAPTRSEIRISLSVEFPTLSPSTRKMLHRAAFAVTFALCAALAVCYWLGVCLPTWLVLLMVLGASVGWVYGSIHILSEAERFEQEKQKGGKA